jgi:hypothetical protein
MVGDDGSSDDVPVRRSCPVFRPKARPGPAASAAAVAAKRARRVEMETDGYSEWQMNRAEAQRVANGIADTEGVVQSVYRRAEAGAPIVESKPAPEVVVATGPVKLIPPNERPFLRASIPGVTVVRPWADSRYYSTVVVASQSSEPSP